ncbi:MAG TPA: GNAT family N-acyltransferase [Hyphomicrobiaceae bacterium]|nr:GNAT family N-acyltransferase [Hyphomicrobiaceae bacterium]
MPHAQTRDWPGHMPAAGAAVRQSFGHFGPLEVRLAVKEAEIEAAQRLRYEVFYDEMGAVPTQEARRLRLDRDHYDAVCDHLLVIERVGAAGAAERIVGTYRLLRRDVAARVGLPLYTSTEFDLSPLLAGSGARLRLMELGRSCVARGKRDRRTLEALWHGIWAYVRSHGIEMMIGCASFPGVDPAKHRRPLDYLHRHHLAPHELRCRALTDRYVSLTASDGAGGADERATLRALPPLVKGYLRLGAFVGDGAVVDHAFGTTDVLVILPVERIDPRYFDHFGAPEGTDTRLRQG